MLIECADCDSKVDAELVAHREFHPDGEMPIKYCFLECPACKNAMIGLSELYQAGLEEWEWSNCVRQWPNPHKDLITQFPSQCDALWRMPNAASRQRYMTRAPLCAAKRLKP